jgi:predicted dehydrogenase
MQTFKWGFVGAGMIAKKALYPAISKSSVGEIYAVASRDADRAMTISPKGLIYTDYDQMFADPAVDGVYISLPNAFHLPTAIKAMKAGKHVLCEKPLGMNAAEVREAIEVSEKMGVLFVEASWNRWHPRTQRVHEIVRSGKLGAIKRIRTAFTYSGLDDANIRLDPTIGGGILYDLGPYSTVAPLWLLDFPKVENLSVQTVFHEGGVDETTRVNYKLGNTVCETVASCNIPDSSWFIVEGEKGSVRMGGMNAFNSHNAPSDLEIEIDGVTTIENFRGCDPYQLMADSFAGRARGGSDWVMPLSESLRFAELFDAAFALMKK